jgi:hypothetical protein
MTYFLVDKDNLKNIIAMAEEEYLLNIKLNGRNVILSNDEFMANFVTEPVAPAAIEEQPISDGLDTIEPVPNTEP